jgi:hypothetical protein
MAKNEFLVQRIAKATFTLNGALTATSLHSSGVYIPKGAIITGIRMVAPNAVTLTAASGTVQLAVGAVNIVATSNVSALGAVTVPSIKALATTTGNYITVNSEIKLTEGVSNNSSAVASYDVYVDYLYA